MPLQGIASGVLGMMKHIGMVLGVAVSGAVFTSSRQWLTVSLKNQYAQNTQLASAAFAGALHVTYLVFLIHYSELEKLQPKYYQI